MSEMSTGDRFETSRWLWRSVGRGVAFGLLCGLVVLGAAQALGSGGLPVALTLAVPVASCALAQLVRGTFHEMVPVQQGYVYTPPVNTAGIPRLKQLERRLQRASTDLDKFDWSLRPTLTQLATERLRNKHGINVRTEPERARAMVGEPLWLIMSTPQNGPRSAPTRAQLTALIEAIEAL
ncbi:MAG: hypothetical protein ABI140_05780 [Jatrophihabitantaceae bacterium]